MTPRALLIQELIAARRLTMVQSGKAIRITGPGVDITTCDLQNLSPSDLTPIGVHGKDKAGGRIPC